MREDLRNGVVDGAALLGVVDDAVGDVQRYGRVKRVVGETIRSVSAPATVISLNVEPGSYVSVTVRFRCRSIGADGKRFAS